MIIFLYPGSPVTAGVCAETKFVTKDNKRSEKKTLTGSEDYLGDYQSTNLPRVVRVTDQGYVNTVYSTATMLTRSSQESTELLGIFSV